MANLNTKNLNFIKNSELKKFLSHKNFSILNAMKRMNKTYEKFQIIINSKKEILGTLTDGDIRRFLIKGGSIQEKVEKCMNKKPLIGKIHENNKNISKINKINIFPAFLPIINPNNKIHSIIVAFEETNIDTAIIMAGGLGSRLGNLTKKIPKPLLKINGVTTLEKIIRNLERANIKKIYISVNYLKEKIIEFIKNKKFNSKIIFIQEKKKLGTAGSLSLIKSKIKSPITVINADVITSLSIASLIEFYNEDKPDAMIGAATYEYKVPYGVLRYDELGELLGIEEKPTQKNLIAGGIYVLNQKVINLLSFNERIDMPELLKIALKKDLKLGVFPIHEKWNDIGLPKDYLDLSKKKTAN